MRGEPMAETKRLRQLLDERGIEWWPMQEGIYRDERDTEFVANGRKYTAHEWGGTLTLYNLTPEQAIAVTLRPTSAKRIVKTEDGIIGSCRCGACGESIGLHDAYCRGCGARMEADA